MIIDRRIDISEIARPSLNPVIETEDFADDVRDVNGNKCVSVPRFVDSGRLSCSLPSSPP